MIAANCPTTSVDVKNPPKSNITYSQRLTWVPAAGSPSPSRTKGDYNATVAHANRAQTSVNPANRAFITRSA